MGDHVGLRLGEKAGELGPPATDGQRTNRRLLDPDREQRIPGAPESRPDRCIGLVGLNGSGSRLVDPAEGLPLAANDESVEAVRRRDRRFRVDRSIGLEERVVVVDEPVATPDDAPLEPIEELVDPRCQPVFVARHRTVNTVERTAHLRRQPPPAGEAERGGHEVPPVGLPPQHAEVFLHDPTRSIERVQWVDQRWVWRRFGRSADRRELRLDEIEHPLTRRFGARLCGEDLVVTRCTQVVLESELGGASVIDHEPRTGAERSGSHLQPGSLRIQVDLVEPLATGSLHRRPGGVHRPVRHDRERSVATLVPVNEGAAKSLDRLAAVIADVGPQVVGFSGGVDSSLLAVAAARTLAADELLVATADSPSLATGELDECRRLAGEWGFAWRSVRTDELTDDRYVANAGDRCYWCKSALMDALEPLAAERGATVTLGVNVDDLGDHRPGQEAAAARGALFPLVEAELTKADVRALARELDLSVWDRPAMPCLSSRIPYGTAVTVPLLSRVDRAEQAVRALGFTDLRVRHYDNTARIELPAEDFGRAAAMATELVEAVSATGYDYVTLRPGRSPLGQLERSPRQRCRRRSCPRPIRHHGAVTEARLDLDRTRRVDLPEAVYCHHKTTAQCVTIVSEMLADGAGCGDRHPDHPRPTRGAAALQPPPVAAAGSTLTWRHRPATGRRAAVIAAGTSDLPVATECRLTLEALGHEVDVVTDVGVAGLHRLLAALPEFADADVLVAVAGMEGALPTVLAGLVAQPLLAVPTSVGYGTAFEGQTALLSMMTSCAPGIAVVGIDNGYGAACAAHRILAALGRDPSADEPAS